MRTFLAVDLDAEVRASLANLARRLDLAGSRVSLVTARNMHVTLNFLGDVSDQQLLDVCKAAQQTADGLAPFEVTLGEVRCMPPKGVVRVIWVDVHDPNERLDAMQKDLAARLASLGFAPEKRQYRPHVAVGRVRHSHDHPAIRLAVQNATPPKCYPQKIAEIVVYTSELTSTGPIYSPVERAKLARNKS